MLARIRSSSCPPHQLKKREVRGLDNRQRCPYRFDTFSPDAKNFTTWGIRFTLSSPLSTDTCVCGLAVCSSGTGGWFPTVTARQCLDQLRVRKGVARSF